MKKIAYIAIACLIVVVGYHFLRPQAKLDLFVAVEKPWYRLRSDKPNHYLDEAKLEAKVKQGAPEWARIQIAEDLSKYPLISTKDLDAYYKENNSSRNRLMRVSIKEGVVKTTVADPTLLNQKSYEIILHVLQYIARKGYVTNTDFIMSLQDYVEMSGKKSAPIFTFAKDITTPIEKDLILMPDWMNFRSSGELQPRIKFANQLYSWENKIPKLFWRGSTADSTGFRNKLVEMSVLHPNIIDAQFSQMDQTKYVSEEDHVQYRYQVTIDGSRATWERLVWQLHANSLIFKHQSNHAQWFYKGVQPHIDYIPVKDEASLLKEIAWAEEHPKESNQIIQHALNFADNNLALEDMYHYLIVLLQTYNQHLKE